MLVPIVGARPDVQSWRRTLKNAGEYLCGDVESLLVNRGHVHGQVLSYRSNLNVQVFVLHLFNEIGFPLGLFIQ